MTSLQILVLIMELCERDGVPLDVARYFEVTPYLLPIFGVQRPSILEKRLTAEGQLQ